jgi:NSS family neurotransmitter:Na+ symporter
MGGFGMIFGVLFMLCVYVAGFTSILGGSEAMVASLSDSKGIDRKKAATGIVIAEFIFSILFTMSFGTGKLAQIKILNLGFFDFFDFVASFFMCLGAVAMFAYVATRWGFKKFQTEANAGATGKIRIHGWMKWYLYTVFPLVLLFIVYSIITSYF